MMEVYTMIIGILQFTITPLIGILTLGLIPFLFASEGKRFKVSCLIGFIHLAITLFMLFQFDNIVSRLLNPVIVYSLYFLIVWSLDKSRLNKSHFIFIFIIFVILRVVTRAIF